MTANVPKKPSRSAGSVGAAESPPRELPGELLATIRSRFSTTEARQTRLNTAMTAMRTWFATRCPVVGFGPPSDDGTLAVSSRTAQGTTTSGPAPVSVHVAESREKVAQSPTPPGQGTQVSRKQAPSRLLTLR